jgi:2-hydroxy-6-oxonona-2,4-dienedioate hydrolase
MSIEPTPASIVSTLSEQADRIETVCGDGRMVWRRWGRGPALLLLHGGHGSWTHWIRNIPSLSERWSVAVPDMPGFGESALPPDPTRPESLTDVLAHGLNDVFPGNGPIAMVGFSFGGIIAGHLARTCPDRAAHLVLVGSGGLGLPRPAMKPLTKWRHLETVEERNKAHRDNLATLMLRDPARIDALALHLQSENTVRTWINSPAISYTDTLKRCLYDVTAPLSGIWGEADATAGELLFMRQELLRRFDPNAEFIIVPNAGHWVQYEAPDIFNPALEEILNTGRKRQPISGASPDWLTAT